MSDLATWVKNQRRNRKLTEWTDAKEYFTDEDGCKQRKIIQFTKSLDLCFKYLVPKASESMSEYEFHGLMLDWLREVLDKYRGYEALALCKVVEKLMETKKVK